MADDYDGQIEATPENPDAELNALLANPCTYDWTKRVVSEALRRDSVEAVVALEVLAGAFRRRMDAAFQAHMEAARCQGCGWNIHGTEGEPRKYYCGICDPNREREKRCAYDVQREIDRSKENLQQVR